MALKLSVPRDNVTSISSNGPTLATVAPDWVELTQRKLDLLAAKDALLEGQKAPKDHQCERKCALV